MRLFVSAGEASGDAYAGALVREMRALGEPFAGAELLGIGGARVRELGANPRIDSSGWGAIGILEALRVAIPAYRSYLRAKRMLATGSPGLFLPIDFGYMNVKLSRHAKRLGWKVLYFVPPGSWRRDRQGRDLPEVADAIVSPFEWSARLLQDMGARAYWFGHPLKQLVRDSAGSNDERRSGVAVLPGSRQHEIESNLGVIVDALRGLGLAAEVAVASTTSAATVRSAWIDQGGDPSLASFTENDVYGVLKRSRAAIVCSGTATLEAALCGCPCVVIYRGSKMMEWEYRIRRPKFNYISLPNILLDRPLLLELIQWDAKRESVRREMEALLEDGPRRFEVLEGYRELDAMLGGDRAVTQTAELASELTADQSHDR